MSVRPRVKSSRAKSRRPRSTPRTSEESGERLQKVLAAAGLGSRRACESLIQEGRVEIDRRVVTELGTRVDPVSQEIRVDGEALPQPRRAYYIVHKVQGILSTANDPSGRPRVTDMVPPHLGRLFPVGRLDMSSEGLILLTNDGELANRLTHPRYGIEKMYQVQVAGQIEQGTLDRLEKGVHLAEGVAKVVGVKIKGHHKNSTILEMVLDEGRNREIRRLLAHEGHKVQRLIRIAIGPLRLSDLPPGAYRALAHEEIAALRAAVAGDGGKGSPRKSAKSRGQRRETGSRKLLQQRKKMASGVGGVQRPGRAKTTDNAPRSVAPAATLEDDVVLAKRSLRTVISDEADAPQRAEAARPPKAHVIQPAPKKKGAGGAATGKLKSGRPAKGKPRFGAAKSGKSSFKQAQSGKSKSDGDSTGAAPLASVVRTKGKARRPAKKGRRK